MRRILILVISLLWSLSSSSQCLKVHQINVGQGSSTLIEAFSDDCSTREFAMLIDAGLQKAATTINNYLDDAGVTALDAIIATHYDQDHYGGFVGTAINEGGVVRRNGVAAKLKLDGGIVYDLGFRGNVGDGTTLGQYQELMSVLEGFFPIFRTTPLPGNFIELYNGPNYSIRYHIIAANGVVAGPEGTVEFPNPNDNQQSIVGVIQFKKHTGVNDLNNILNFTYNIFIGGDIEGSLDQYRATEANVNEYISCLSTNPNENDYNMDVMKRYPTSSFNRAGRVGQMSRAIQSALYQKFVKIDGMIVSHHGARNSFNALPGVISGNLGMHDLLLTIDPETGTTIIDPDSGAPIANPADPRARLALAADFSLDFAIIPSGKQSSYRHPRLCTLNNLSQGGNPIAKQLFMTDSNRYNNGQTNRGLIDGNKTFYEDRFMNGHIVITCAPNIFGLFELDSAVIYAPSDN